MIEKAVISCERMEASMINNIKKISNNDKFCYIVTIFLILRAVNITINETIKLSNSSSFIIKLILIILFCIVDLFLFLILDKKKRKQFILLEIFVVFLMVLTYVRYPAIGFNLFLSYSWLFFSFIPILFAMLCITDKYMFYNYLKKSSYIISLCCTLIYFFHVRKLSTNLVFSYTLLFPYLLHIVELVYKKNYKIILLLVLETYMLLTYSARGTLVCSMIFIFFMIINKLGFKSLKYLLGLCIILILIYGILYKFGFFTSLYEYFLAQGKYYRILDLISKGAFFDNNGRFEIYNNYFNFILKKPILGWGIGADLYIGIFPHNVFIELVFDFGFILGFVFIIGIIIMSLFCFKEKNNILFIILFCCGLLPLFFSFSYLEWMYFWVFIGYIIIENKDNFIHFVNNTMHYLKDNFKLN